MKQKILFALGCAMVAGFAQAAQVEGNNVAVVIDKAPVVSETGWQFLCVPVRGFDITGQGKASLTLDELIPPTTEGLPEGTDLQIKQGEDTLVYKLTGGQWTASEGTSATTDAGATAVPPGAFLWVKAQTPTANSALADALAGLGLATFAATDAVETSSAPAIRFMGEQNTPTADHIVPETISGMTAFGNASSEGVDIYDLIAAPQERDQVLRIGEGLKDYRTYVYRRGAWYVLACTLNGTGGSTTTSTRIEKDGADKGQDVRTIAPGEAFYYYR